MLGHKCQWNICAIHTNELPIRHLIQKLDGPTTSKDGFTGKIGKLLNKVEELEYNPNFLPIGVDEEDLIQLPESVWKNCLETHRFATNSANQLKLENFQKNLETLS